jgi:hypothetical protein
MSGSNDQPSRSAMIVGFSRARKVVMLARILRTAQKERNVGWCDQ